MRLSLGRFEFRLYADYILQEAVLHPDKGIVTVHAKNTALLIFKLPQGKTQGKKSLTSYAINVIIHLTFNYKEVLYKMNERARKIYHHILDQIIEKTLLENDRIPTEVELARQFQTNRMNAHLAVKMLENERIVQRNKRKGSFVSKNIPSKLILKLKNLSSNRVYVIASPAKSCNIHWNESTLREIESILNSNGYKVFHKELPPRLTRKCFHKMFSEIKEVGPCAIVILPGRGESALLKDNLDIIYDYEGEMYLFDRGAVLLDKWPFHLISLDLFGEGIMAGRYLYERGHRNIVFLEEDSKEKIYWGEERRNGLRFGLNLVSKGKTEPDTWSFPIDSMYQSACEKIAKSKVKFAIVALNDYLAAGLVEYASKVSLAAPRDFSLISFDNNAEFRKYNLTTVVPPLKDIGGMFGQLISKNQWLKRDGNRISIKVSSRIVERDTCE